MRNKSYPYYDTPNIKSMQELIVYCAKTYGETIAFEYSSGNSTTQKSYKNLIEDVTALCHFFIKKGYKRTHIALLGENSYYWLVSYFAIVNSNNIVVPLDKELSSTELSDIIKRSNSEVIIYSDNYEEEASCNKNQEHINLKNLPNIISENKTNQADNFDFIGINENDVCAIVYTSGTTSTPKGVMLSHKNIVSDTIATSKSVKVSARSLLTLPLHHTYGFVASVTIPMLIGGTIFINSSTRNLLRDINTFKPEYIAVVPLIAEVMYKKIWESAQNKGKAKLLKKLIVVSNALCKIGIDLRRKLFASVIDGLGGNLKILVIGGAPADPECVKGYYSFGIKALVGYGITECSPVVSTVRNEHYAPKSVGTVHPGIKVRISDGEIQVKGDTVYKGYYKNPDANEEAFDGEWFRTGDIGEIRDDFLYITGRIKNLIILSNGKNISPEELEHYLKSNIKEIDEVVVYAENESIFAEIYSNEGHHHLIKEKVFDLNKNQPVYKQIKDVYFRNTEFKKTTTKKIIRSSVGGK